MTGDTAVRLAAVIVAVALSLLPAQAFAAVRTGEVLALAADDDIPGVPIPASPIADTLDSGGDTDDVYRLWLQEGDVISATLTAPGATVGFQPRLFLYGPSAATLRGSDEVALSLQPGFPKSLSYTVRQTGNHYLDVWQDGSSTPAASGNTVVTWSVWRPVYRFYNTLLGTHFYSASEAERRFVIATLSSSYAYEGPSYGVNPFTNSDTLWRFFKPSTGTHFYTADPDEMNRVRTQMAHVYGLEGEAYRVSRGAAPGRIAIHRFFNFRTGTHFYSADEAEIHHVRVALGHTYRYEGPSFYLAQ